jgi:hydrogenase maturation protease
VSTVVIGIGNRDRGDDALGPLTVERLNASPPGEAKLATARDDMLGLLELFDGAEKAILVDAMKTGAEPGRVLRLDASRSAVPAPLEGFVSTHTINLADAIELARALGRLPPTLIVFGVEAGDFTAGARLSPAVEASLAELERLIREECACTKPR